MRKKAKPEAPVRETKGRRTVFPMGRVKIADPDASGKRQVEGYAAVFGNRDAYGDIIVKGAFEQSLRERPDVKVLWQHDSHRPIGLQVDAVEDEFGLRVRGELSSTSLVRDEVVPLMKDGVVNGLSIGYDVESEDYDDNLGAWLLKEITLWEWSPVTFPANELATVSEVKSLGSRREAHAVSVGGHAKALIHELEGYFAKKGRRDALDLPLLEQLHALIGGTLHGEETEQAADALVIEQLKGAHLALDLLEATKE